MHNRFGGHKPTKHPYLLRGRIHCARCASALVGSGAVGKYRYYRCRKNRPGLHRCEAAPILVDLLEAVVWECIRDMLLDHEKLIEGIESERTEAEKARRMIQATIAGIDTQNQKDQAKIDKWQDLYAEGGMTKEQYYAKKAAIGKEIARHNHERQEWVKKLSEHMVLTQDEQAELDKYIRDISTGVDNATFEDKQEYLQWLKVDCIYDDITKDVTVSGIIGTLVRHCEKGFRL